MNFRWGTSGISNFLIFYSHPLKKILIRYDFKSFSQQKHHKTNFLFQHIFLKFVFLTSSLTKKIIQMPKYIFWSLTKPRYVYGWKSLHENLLQIIHLCGGKAFEKRNPKKFNWRRNIQSEMKKKDFFWLWVLKNVPKAFDAWLVKFIGIFTSPLLN